MTATRTKHDPISATVNALITAIGLTVADSTRPYAKWFVPHPMPESVSVPIDIETDWFDVSMLLHDILKEAGVTYTFVEPYNDGKFTIMGLDTLPRCGYCGSLNGTIQHTPDSWPACWDCGGV